MNTEYEKLRAAHLAYKGVTNKERAVFRKEIAELKEVLKSATAPDVEQIDALEIRIDTLEEVVELQKRIITLLEARDA